MSFLQTPLLWNKLVFQQNSQCDERGRVGWQRRIGADGHRSTRSRTPRAPRQRWWRREQSSDLRRGCGRPRGSWRHQICTRWFLVSSLNTWTHWCQRSTWQWWSSRCRQCSWDGIIENNDSKHFFIYKLLLHDPSIWLQTYIKQKQIFLSSVINSMLLWFNRN